MTVATTLQSIPLTKLMASKTNPRATIKPEDVAELAASIKVQGLVHPLLARPHPGKPGYFEIVAGHRRQQAAITAGLAEVPVTVRELSDSQVMEIQIVENLQREGLTGLEEGRGYRQLLDLVQPDGKKLTADDIAKRVAKSRRYVYNKVKLLDLCAEAQGALASGALQESVALLLARVSDKAAQKAALPKLLNGFNDWQKKPMSVVEAEDFLARNVTPDLQRAAFDIKRTDYTANGKPIAADCKSCPKRAGNMPDAFPDKASADLCTDPACFAGKSAAAAAEVLAKAKADGHHVLDAKEAAKVMPHHSHSLKNGLVNLDQWCSDLGMKYGDAVKKAAKQGPIRLTYFENPRQPGEIIECVDLNAAKQAFAKAGLRIRSAAEERQDSSEKTRKENARRARVNELTFTALRTANKGELCHELLAELVECELSRVRGDEVPALLGHAWSPEPLATKTAAAQYFKTVRNDSDTIINLDDTTLKLMLSDMLLAQSFGWWGSHADNLKVLATRLKVDTGAIADQVKADMKAESAAKKATKAPAKAAKDAKPAAAPKAKPAAKKGGKK